MPTSSAINQDGLVSRTDEGAYDPFVGVTSTQHLEDLLDKLFPQEQIDGVSEVRLPKPIEAALSVETSEHRDHVLVVERDADANTNSSALPLPIDAVILPIDVDIEGVEERPPLQLTAQHGAAPSRGPASVSHRRRLSAVQRSGGVDHRPPPPSYGDTKQSSMVTEAPTAPVAGPWILTPQPMLQPSPLRHSVVMMLMPTTSTSAVPHTFAPTTTSATFPIAYVNNSPSLTLSPAALQQPMWLPAAAFGIR